MSEQSTLTYSATDGASNGDAYTPTTPGREEIPQVQSTITSPPHRRGQG